MSRSTSKTRPPRTKGQSEAALTRAVLAMLRTKFPGMWTKIHQNMFTGAGMADIIGCYRGHYIAIELKKPKKYKNPRQGCTPLQLKWLSDAASAGAMTLVADSLQDVEGFMKSVNTCQMSATRCICGRYDEGLEELYEDQYEEEDEDIDELVRLADEVRVLPPPCTEDFRDLPPSKTK